MYRTDFLREKNIEFQQIQNSNDLVFAIKCFVEAEKICFVKDELVFIRRRNKGSVTTKSDKNWRCYFESYEAADEVMAGYPFFERVRKGYEARKIEALRYFFKKAGVLNKIPYYLRLKKEIKKMQA